MNKLRNRIVSKLFFLLSLSFLLFTSCENFLNNDDIRENIESIIDYNNAPTYVIFLDVQKGSGSVKNLVTEQLSKKVTDTFTIKFEPADGYKFIRWEAVSSTPLPAGDDIYNYIEFETPENLETTVKFKKASSSIVIRPVCLENLKVVEFNLSNADKIYPRDSSIILKFNREIKDECLDKIVIKKLHLPEGKTFRDYYKAPVKLESDPRTVVFYADIDWDNYNEDDFIPIVNGEENPEVYAPLTDLFYEVTDYSSPIQVFMESDLSYSFRINSENSKKTKIHFAVSDENAGTFMVDGSLLTNGIVEYSVGKTVNIRYNLDEQYIFQGWKITKTSADDYGNETVEDYSISDTNQLNLSFSFGDYASSAGYDKINGRIQAAITINNQLENGIVTITPQVMVAPMANVKLEGSHGIMTPIAKNYSVKQGATNDINFRTDSTFAFIRWEPVLIYDGEDKNTHETIRIEEKTDRYIYIEDPYSETTTYELISIPNEEEFDGLNPEIVLRAIVAERPQIISNTPKDQTVLLDTAIQVRFDYEMDPASIYFTQNEKDSIVADSWISYKDQGKDFYGYVKDGKTVFKNIIIENSDTHTDLTYCFTNPVFKDPRTLLIEVIKKKDTNNKDYALLPQYSKVLVKISGDFFYSVDKVPVKVGEQTKKWEYYTTGKIDTTGPQIKGNETTAPVFKFNGVEISPSSTVPSLTSAGTDGTGLNGIKTYRYAKKDTDNFTLDMLVNDQELGGSGSGPDSSFILVTQMIKDSSYNDVTNSSEKNISIPFSVVSDQTKTAERAKDAPLTELANLSSGVYSLYIKVRDKSGNESIYPSDGSRYYICIDKTAPNYSTNDFGHYLENKEKGITREEGTIYLDYKTDKVLDFSKLSMPIYCYSTEEASFGNGSTKGINKGEAQKVTGLQSGTLYKMDPYFYDYAGNRSNPYYYYQFTIPARPKNVEVSTAYGTTVTLTSTKPDVGNFSGVQIRYRKAGSSDSWSTAVTGAVSETTAIKEITGLPKGTKFEFEVCSYDDTPYPTGLSQPKRMDLIPAVRYGIPYKNASNALPTFTTVPDDITITGVDYASNANSLTVNYTRPVNGDYTGIKIYYSKNANFSDNLTPVKILKASASGTYTLTGLAAGTKYWVKAEAYYETEANKSSSNVKTAYTMPNSVDDVYFDEWGSSYLCIDWDTAPAGEYSSYEVWYKLNSESASNYHLASNNVAKNSGYWYIGDGDGINLVAGGLYDVKVVTVIKDIENNVSVTNKNYAPVRTLQLSPDCPKNLKAVKKDSNNNAISLSWTLPSGYYDGLTIRYTTCNTNGTIKNSFGSSVMATAITASTNNSITVPSDKKEGGRIVLNNKNITNYTINGLTQNGYYYIWVESYFGTFNTNNNYYQFKYNVIPGDETSSTTAYTYGTTGTRLHLALDAVTNLKATNNSSYPTERINLSWTNPTDSTGYDGIEISRKLNGADESTYEVIAASSYSTSNAKYIAKSATSYTSTGLSANKKYDYRVRTYKSSVSAQSAENSITQSTLSSSVSSFTATVNGPNSVSLSWSNPAAVNYKQIKVYYGSTLYSTYNNGTTSCTLTGLTGGTPYTFYVKTTNIDDVVSTSYPAGLTRTTTPAPVTGLSSTARTTTSNTISWTKPSGTYTGVKVYYKLNNAGSWTLFNTYANNTTTSCEVTGLTAGLCYNFMVESYLTNVSNISSTSQASITSYTRPNAVTNLRTTSQTTDSLTLNWTKPANNVDNYYLYYKKSTSSSYSYLNISNANTTSYTLTGLTAGTKYDVYITSYYKNYGTSCTVVSNGNVTYPLAPTNVTATIDSGKVKISWTVPEGSPNYFNVYYSTSNSSSSASSIGWQNSTATSYTFSSGALPVGQKYYFWVKSDYWKDDVDLISSFSSSTYIYTPPQAASSVSIYADDGMGNIRLKWTNPSAPASGSNKAYIYVGGNQRTYMNCSNGSVQYALVTIPSYSRSSTYNVSIKIWNSNSGFGPETSVSLGTNSNGLLKINGSYHSYSGLTRVLSSSTKYTKVGKGTFTGDRTITLGKYSMGTYEVTQELWYAVMGYNPSNLNYDSSSYYPVNNVTWYEAVAFCNKLSALQGLTPCYTISGIDSSWWESAYMRKGGGTNSSSNIYIPTSTNTKWNEVSLNQYATGYHLPTEAQWECAAWSADTSKFGNSYANIANTDSAIWNTDTAKGSTHLVYSSPTTSYSSNNSLGLYNMCGNVYEWLTEWDNVYKNNKGTFIDPTTSYSSSCSTYYYAQSGTKKILAKGGAYDRGDSYCHVSTSDDYMYEPYSTSDGDRRGLRLCRNTVY